MLGWVSNWFPPGSSVTSAWPFVDFYQFLFLFITLPSLHYFILYLTDGEELGPGPFSYLWGAFSSFVRSQNSTLSARLALHMPSLVAAIFFLLRFYTIIQKNAYGLFCNGVPKSDEAIDVDEATLVYRFYLFVFLNQAFNNVCSAVRGQSPTPSPAASVLMWWTFVYYAPGKEVCILGAITSTGIIFARVAVLVQHRLFKVLFYMLGFAETLHFLYNWWHGCRLPYLYFLVHYVSSIWLIGILSVAHWFLHLSATGWALVGFVGVLSITGCCVCMRIVQAEAVKRQQERIANSPFIPAEHGALSGEDASLTDRVSSDGRQLAETGLGIALKMMSAASSVSGESHMLEQGFEDTCVVCMTSPAAVKLLPCGHACLCGPCSRTYAIYGARNPSSPVYKTCPLCRAEVAESVILRDTPSRGFGDECVDSEDEEGASIVRGAELV